MREIHDVIKGIYSFRKNNPHTCASSFFTWTRKNWSISSYVFCWWI